MLLLFEPKAALGKWKFEVYRLQGPISVADPGNSIGGADPIVGRFCSNPQHRCFLRKRMQKQKNWVPLGAPWTCHCISSQIFQECKHLQSCWQSLYQQRTTFAWSFQVANFAFS